MINFVNNRWNGCGEENVLSNRTFSSKFQLEFIKIDMKIEFIIYQNEEDTNILISDVRITTRHYKKKI